MIHVEGTKKGREKQKLTLVEIVKKNMPSKEAIENTISDRIE